jgi:hypothetical protein
MEDETHSWRPLLAMDYETHLRLLQKEVHQGGPFRDKEKGQSFSKRRKKEGLFKAKGRLDKHRLIHKF